MDKEIKSELIKSQALQLTQKYKGLELYEGDNCSHQLKGVLAFEGEYKGRIITDSLDIEIHISPGYPSELPAVKETGYRVSREFHINPGDNTLCLAAPLAVKIQFSLDRTLLGFLENLVIPFFFNYVHLQESGSLPFGERSHGTQGILEFYSDFFQCPDQEVILRLLKILGTSGYQGYEKCPCRSGKNLRNCHGRQLLKCMQLQSPQEFMAEYSGMMELLRKGKADQPLLW